MVRECVTPDDKDTCARVSTSESREPLLAGIHLHTAQSRVLRSGGILLPQFVSVHWPETPLEESWRLLGLQSRLAASGSRNHKLSKLHYQCQCFSVENVFDAAAALV